MAEFYAEAAGLVNGLLHPDAILAPELKKKRQTPHETTGNGWEVNLKGLKPDEKRMGMG